VNRLRGYWRQRQTGPQSLDAQSLAEKLNGLEDPASDLNRLWDREHDQFIARRLLQLLEPEFTASTWQAFRRQVMDGLCAADAAAELGLSVNAVLIAKSRVLRRFREEIAGLTD
jgi:RNA polymerase sigma-70 factor (ECF subfamily)